MYPTPASGMSPMVARQLQAIVRCEMLPLAFLTSSFCPGSRAGLLKDLQSGKYSRWVCTDNDVERRVKGIPLTQRDLAPGCCFGWIATLAWAVRFIGVSANADVYRPPCGFKPYNPLASRQAYVGDGWDIDNASLGNYRTRHPLTSLGLFFLEAASNLGKALYPHNLFIDGTSLSTMDMFQTYPDALDLAKHARLCGYLLRQQDDALLSLFWDCDGITCRGAENVVGVDGALSTIDLKDVAPEWRDLMRPFRNVSDYIHVRQVPHMINIVRLCEHVEEGSKNTNVN
eukprot:PhM_4_TR2413/c2_g1_i1/m.74333